QVSIEKAGTKAYRIADITELDIEWIKDAKKVAVTAGASTPTQLVREVLLFLEQFDAADKTTWKREHNQDFERILPKTKNKYMAEKRRQRLAHLKNGGS
ncbi:4-hydroxy-3-methylbut-2-enyl diphosphate reductase, partial [Listeria monocytogenes]|nr:4-hydroxy-3-methylbut-2-enyl diphosphate reductase [Listeria monocytogenes]